MTVKRLPRRCRRLGDTHASDRACVANSSRSSPRPEPRSTACRSPASPVTGSDFVVVLPKLSVAATVSVSALVELSSSFRVVRSAIDLGQRAGDGQRLAAAGGRNRPAAAGGAGIGRQHARGVRHLRAVKVSPLVLPLSDTLTLEIAVATFCATAALAGALIDGAAPFTVTAIEVGPADPPVLSEAVTEIASDAVVASVSASVVRSARSPGTACRRWSTSCRRWWA